MGLGFVTENRTDQNTQLRFRPEECTWQRENGDNTIPVSVVMSTFEGGVYRVKVETEQGKTFVYFILSSSLMAKKGYVRIPEERLYVYGEA